MSSERDCVRHSNLVPCLLQPGTVASGWESRVFGIIRHCNQSKLQAEKSPKGRPPGCSTELSLIPEDRDSLSGLFTLGRKHPQLDLSPRGLTSKPPLFAMTPQVRNEALALLNLQSLTMTDLIYICLNCQ
ncbi:hypothetical protein PR048_008657 [Dryococelus australis]|uniref:Uncharacterized protein n=1 Tax=Dryococelus australis TaxID=614101 RepID=A0ABQ9HZH9_9NEOP|nr:hypothetical protein PR048_008657 [Dryococelus australis]